MVIYEVTAKVRPELCEQFESYMRGTHIPDLLKTGSFSEATFAKGEPGSYRIQYEANTREDLDRYLEGYAPTLRKDLFDRFPEGIELSRSEWGVIEKW